MRRVKRRHVIVHDKAWHDAMMAEGDPRTTELLNHVSPTRPLMCSRS